jgi:hypothetical protein
MSNVLSRYTTPNVLSTYTMSNVLSTYTIPSISTYTTPNILSTLTMFNILSNYTMSNILPTYTMSNILSKYTTPTYYQRILCPTYYQRILCPTYFILPQRIINISHSQHIILHNSVTKTHSLGKTRENNTTNLRKREHAVIRWVEALRYKPEGRGFDCWWGHWDFSPSSLRGPLSL